MSDFETMPRGSIMEVKLSRELVREMEQIMQQHGRGIFPANVLAAYDKLSTHYALCLMSEGL